MTITTATVLCLRYSRQHAIWNGNPSSVAIRKTNETESAIYSTSTLVVSTEVMKFILGLVSLLFRERCNPIQTSSVFYEEILYKYRNTLLMAIPSVLYVIQDNLVIISLCFLEAATFQILYQFRIITTAFFSVLLLGKQIDPYQWAALVSLMAGVALVQFQGAVQGSVTTEGRLRYCIGIAAALMATGTSGFAGVYFERLFKYGHQSSLVIRNIQLGLFAIPFAIVGVIFKDGEKVHRLGFFHGYWSLIWIIVFLQAFGGYLVSASIKYADNILKTFATTISIILSCLYSYFVAHELSVDFSFLLGTVVILVSIAFYCYRSNKQQFYEVDHSDLVLEAQPLQLQSESHTTFMELVIMRKAFHYESDCK